MAILIWPAIFILSVGLLVNIHCEECTNLHPFAEIISSSLEVEYRTVQEDGSYDLTANFSWKHPGGSGYDKFIVRSVRADRGDSFSSLIKCEDDTFNIVTDTFFLFTGLQYGSTYVFQLGLYESSTHAVTRPATEYHNNAPDCYIETGDLSFCASRDIATIGMPVDVRIDDVIKYQHTIDTVTAFVTWRRPVQINGKLKFFLLNVASASTNKNIFNKLLTVQEEHASGPDVTFYRYINGIAEGTNFILTVTAYVLLPEEDFSSIPGPAYSIACNATPTVYPTVIPTTEGSGDSYIHIEVVPFRMASLQLVETSSQPQIDSYTTHLPDESTESKTEAKFEETTPHMTPPPDESTEAKVEVTTPYMTRPPDPGQSEWTKVLLYSGLPALVVACSIAAILIHFRRQRRTKSSDETLFIRYLENGNADKPPTPKVKRPSIDFTPRDPAFEGKEFDRSLLKIEKELGAGQFGIVYKAYAFGLNGVKEYVPVAVKSLRVNATPAMEEDFLSEIKLMIDLGPHSNILQIVGCCTNHEPFYLITEYMKYGDLLHFLWKCREDKYRRQDSMFDLTPANQLQICRQISRGMEYICKTRYYHGDLAARNVLVGEGLQVKISDFGLADDIYQSGYKRLAPDKKRPVKWVSLETNTIGRCTIQSDVWSFGVVMYEIYTLGGIPYPGMDGREIISKLQDGYRMPKPDQCPDDVYDIMRACWHANPSERPTFTCIFKRFDDMLAVDSDYLTAEIDDGRKFNFATAPSTNENVPDLQELAGEDVKLSTPDEGEEEDEEERGFDEQLNDMVAMETASLETSLGQGNDGFEMEEEECSASTKRDSRILLDPSREQGRGSTQVV